MAILAAMTPCAVYATTAEVIFDNSVAGQANVTIKGGNLASYYMYGTYQTNPCAVGTIGAASCQDTDGNAPIEKFDSAIVTMEGGEGLDYLCGYGVGGNAFEGDVTVNLQGGSVNVLVGGTYYASGVNRDRDVLGSDPGYDHESFGYKSNYGNEADPSANRQNININITGGEVGQIRGGHSGHSNSHIYSTYLPKVIAAGEEAVTEFMKSNPVAVSGNINISITGGSVKAASVGETAAVQGAGGTGFSVDGTSCITVGGDAIIEGDVFAGSSNVYTFVGASEINIEGGSITGNIYAGGNGSGSPKIAAGPSPMVKGDTVICITGGTITGNVYGAGLGDVVNGNTSVEILGGTVSGIISGGGVKSTVNGTRTLNIGDEDTAYTGSVAVADFTAISVVNGTVTLTACTAAPEGSDLTVEKDANLTVDGEAAFKNITLNGCSLTAENLTAENITLGAGSYGVLDGVYVAGDDENGFVQDAGRQSIGLSINDTGATVTDADGVEYRYDADKGQYTAAGEIHYDTYYINTEEHGATVSEIAAAGKDKFEQVEMKAGILYADASAKVNATGGSIHMTGQDVNISGTLSGDTSVVVLGTGTITGENTHTGATVIDGESAKLTVASATALGTGVVVLQDHGTLDLNGMEVSNTVYVVGCTISRAGNYKGKMNVSGNLTLTDATQAASVTLVGNGTVSGASLTTGSITKQFAHSAPVDFSCPVTVLEGGDIFIEGDAPLSVAGSLTLGDNVTIHLSDKFTLNDTIIAADSLELTGGSSSIVLEGTSYELTHNEEDGELVLTEKEDSTPDEEDTPVEEEKPEVDTPIVDAGDEAEPAPVFDQATADVLAQSNWGIITASRAFVGTVQGQRNNMGCIANGRGTAWASLLGGMTDISGSGAAAGSDITLFGAAVGVDMKVGKRSSLGVAFGYTDGEVSADGLGDIDQESGHIALYGEHGLKKFANNSCLSLDWVAATGTTESKYMGAKWEQDSIQLNTRLTWNKQVTDRFSYNVFGGLEYFASESDRTMNCKSGSVQNLRGELGVGVRYVAKQGTQPITDGKCTPAPACERVVLYGEVSYINDMVRNNPTIEVDGLRGNGANPGRQGVGLEAGVTIRLGEKWSASANYSFNAMDDSNEHVLNIGASRTF